MVCLYQQINKAPEQLETNRMPPFKKRKATVLYHSQKGKCMYYVSYNDYFGFCVIEENDGNGKIVFAGSIEDCNKKCIELNTDFFAGV